MISKSLSSSRLGLGNAMPVHGLTQCSNFEDSSVKFLISIFGMYSVFGFVSLFSSI